jgi:hypothetical protein
VYDAAAFNSWLSVQWAHGHSYNHLPLKCQGVTTPHRSFHRGVWLHSEATLAPQYTVSYLSDGTAHTAGTKLCALLLFIKHARLFQPRVRPVAPSVTAKRDCDQGTVTNTRTGVIVTVVVIIIIIISYSNGCYSKSRTINTYPTLSLTTTPTAGSQPNPPS